MPQIYIPVSTLWRHLTPSHFSSSPSATACLRLDCFLLIFWVLFLLIQLIIPSSLPLRFRGSSPPPSLKFLSQDAGPVAIVRSTGLKDLVCGEPANVTGVSNLGLGLVSEGDLI
ncbi:hypothetical protein KFK09_015259 [Dendrobium nobile]|uniref:Uncharacterized protein n=1 Tax=Dendrobium nobile TaxID=94219 RepID=A0A8T3B400_DENNO|nr:hypothetical protein KFK09_015259 [Dendrobium nobile]